MKASELRIGNLVWYTVDDSYDERNRWNEVNTIDIEDLAQLLLSDDNYKPIPLTDEWLIKLNFEKINHINGYSFWSFKIIKGRRDFICEIYDKRTVINSINIKQHCEYVHQLQNLYFALTGEELILK